MRPKRNRWPTKSPPGAKKAKGAAAVRGEFPARSRPIKVLNSKLLTSTLVSDYLAAMRPRAEPFRLRSMGLCLVATTASSPGLAILSFGKVQGMENRLYKGNSLCCLAHGANPFKTASTRIYDPA